MLSTEDLRKSRPAVRGDVLVYRFDVAEPGGGGEGVQLAG
jgi:hypothetical protein